jgi:hypothetical protein
MKVIDGRTESHERQPGSLPGWVPGRHLSDNFHPAPKPDWRRPVKGAAALEPSGDTLRFVLDGATRRHYSNAQIDDYQDLPRRRFPWNPPLRLTVRARFSHPASRLLGTAGFGFWNDPFVMTGGRLPWLPRAVWFFFASPPANMKLDPGVPGYGWKAATIDAPRPAALPLALLALPAVLLMNIPALYRILWPPIQRAVNIGEALVPAEMTDWHTYVLDWGRDRARFFVDPAPGPLEEPFLEAPSPRGPQGLVLWVDNQYLVITPQGRFRWGVLDVPQRQWLEVDHVTVEATEA